MITLSSIRLYLVTTVSLILLMGMVTKSAIAQAQETEPVYDEMAVTFASLVVLPDTEWHKNLDLIEQNWQSSYVSMAMDVITLVRRSEIRDRLLTLIKKESGENFGNDLDAWLNWMWNHPEDKYDHYAQFKSLLFGLIDQNFRDYFSDERQTTIRLDEVRWGGVHQDGIPPLRQPKMIAMEDADYLEDDHVVFGIEINGDARAYPKRILAWHEMFVDNVGGTDFAGVYCTLCGAVILYETRHDGVDHALGTSGFLYRSNKLMYDQQTQSLWSTTRGEPVVGPLVGKNITLQRSYVVTTTWGEWRDRHPHTKVLSLDTGHQRDYGEGVAYQAYFSTDELMFTVPKTDQRLRNKDEVLALTFPKKTEDTMAIHADYLLRNPVYHTMLGPVSMIVLTDRTGANRVYEIRGQKFTDFDQQYTVTDDQGKQWTLTEDALTSSSGEKLNRLPAHRAFWFGWYAVHNDTILIM